MSDYRKFIIEVKRVHTGYRLWKRGMDAVTCMAETYKNKRSIYFAASNLLPSEVLMREYAREYHLILIGVDEGGLIHQDFGVFHVNSAGDGSLFKKFSGPSIECYTHCLLVTLHRDGGSMETIFSGEMPFYQPEREIEQERSNGMNFEEDCTVDEHWQAAFAAFSEEDAVEIFDAEIDETGARWCRISQIERLPQSLAACSDCIARYGHYTVGKCEDRWFVGVPGRFLQREQPCREQECFLLWQPIRGGEKYFSDLSELTGQLQEEIFGYWIGGIDRESGEILPL